ncbi:hypothetical protein M409DRAFT_29610 [Zasmidium cellare ATCC 36951]|uniref:Uncharacterized protein n=1 Tax=Zasmidium cellare ATCC 36951 TaxID=1080233 RepID=A0A6A6BYX5_ZASCE|nr:uncharacterized protein M409DRAFT_29610 [Zasmidium cellare ATCC 36951]KAF2159997.1 hypothetical protein M409DRAFT_29610 [Zasmidium cellare ATCC 36951]
MEVSEEEEDLDSTVELGKYAVIYLIFPSKQKEGVLQSFNELHQVSMKQGQTVVIQATNEWDEIALEMSPKSILIELSAKGVGALARGLFIDAQVGKAMIKAKR